MKKLLLGLLGLAATMSAMAESREIVSPSGGLKVCVCDDGGIAKAANPGRVDVTVPAYYRNNLVGFVSSLEELTVTPDKMGSWLLFPQIKSPLPAGIGTRSSGMHPHMW